MNGPIVDLLSLITLILCFISLVNAAANYDVSSKSYIGETALSFPDFTAFVGQKLQITCAATSDPRTENLNIEFLMNPASKTVVERYDGDCTNYKKNDGFKLETCESTKSTAKLVFTIESIKKDHAGKAQCSVTGSRKMVDITVCDEPVDNDVELGVESKADPKTNATSLIVKATVKNYCFVPTVSISYEEKKETLDKYTNESNVLTYATELSNFKSGKITLSVDYKGYKTITKDTKFGEDDEPKLTTAGNSTAAQKYLFIIIPICVIVLLIIIAAIIVSCYVHKRNKRRKRRRGDRPPISDPILMDGVRHPTAKQNNYVVDTELEPKRKSRVDDFDDLPPPPPPPIDSDNETFTEPYHDSPASHHSGKIQHEPPGYANVGPRIVNATGNPDNLHYANIPVINSPKIAPDPGDGLVDPNDIQYERNLPVKRDDYDRDKVTEV